MARKQPNLDNLFKPTETQPEAEEAPAPGQPLQAERSAPASDVDRTLPIGVGLKASELQALDRIAAELGIARNALMRFALAYFLREYRAGRVDVKVEREERRRVIMP